MGEKRRQYTRELEIEAVRLVDESGRSKARIARELGIHECLLTRWQTRREGSHPAAEAFPGNGRLSAAEQEVRRPRHEPRGTKGGRQAMTKKKPVPRFASEAEEQELWDEHDSTEHIEWSEARPVVLADLRPATRTISQRLPKR